MHCASSNVSEYSLKCVSMSNVDELVVRDLKGDARRDEPYRNTITSMRPTTSCHARHVIVGGGGPRYRCHYCRYISRNRNDYLHHQLFHRQRPSAIRFQCEQCEYGVSEKRLLSQHHKVHHCICSRLPVLTEASPTTLTTSPERCDIIGGETDLKVSVLFNCSDAEDNECKKSWPMPPLTPSKNSSANSLMCDNVEDWNISTTKHCPAWIAQSAGDGDESESVIESRRRKWWRCDRCPYTTSKRSQLAFHVGLHGSAQRYKCVHCDYSVSGYHLLMQHIRLHATQRHLNQTSQP